MSSEPAVRIDLLQKGLRSECVNLIRHDAVPVRALHILEQLLARLAVEYIGEDEHIGLLMAHPQATQHTWLTAQPIYIAAY